MALTEQEITNKLLGFPGWEFANNGIVKTYSLPDFETAMKLVNQVAMIAENAQHHPDIEIKYSKVTFSLSTHSEGGVTEKDFKLAKQIEQAAVMG